MRFRDPSINRTRDYEAFSLGEVVNLGFGGIWDSTDFSGATFTAGDKDEVYADLDRIRAKGGYIAFQGIDVAGAERMDHGTVDPAPYYLFWTEEGQGKARAGFELWNLAVINLVRFEEQYPNVFPHGAPKGSAIHRGFELFRRQCFHCHSMGQQGGRIGSDLNAPGHIIAYPSKESLGTFVREPIQLCVPNMPAFPQLTDQDIDDLVAYFRRVSKWWGKSE